MPTAPTTTQHREPHLGPSSALCFCGCPDCTQDGECICRDCWCPKDGPR
jgi:hypothetical protein